MNPLYAIAISIFLFVRSSQGIEIMAADDETPGSMFDDTVDNAKTGMSSMREKVTDATDDMKEAFYSKTEKMGDNTKTGMDNLREKVIEAAGDMKEAVSGNTEKTVDSSPKSTEEAGSQVGDAIDLGVQYVKDATKERSTSEKIRESAKEAGSTLGGMIDSVVQKVMNTIIRPDDSAKCKSNI
ncbi:unnamed protein product [Cylindrotheca closterium]|uniref:Secreted protein n=1 Tax=Cylindrotheca closterium TaxID=2856 RepID=A0AAD2FGD7_9STRA|nr:unnamed protein product [Cylindrotheca closterium]